jgi:hypothetical protein
VFAGSEWPAAPPAKRGGGAIALVLVIAVIVAGGGVIAATVRSTHPYPKTWDRRIAPIAAEVEHLRGLKYKHAVPVHFLDDAAFEKRVSLDQHLSADDRAQYEREGAVLRALGLIEGHVDVLKALNAQSTGATLAYYSFTDKQIVVRGTNLDASHRVTLAHELTHVLQDQYFDLTKLEKQAQDSDTGDESALRALIEGDAVRIEDKYKARLSNADQRAYDREQEAEGERASGQLSSVPDVLNFLGSAPYELGPITMKVLEKLGGNARINDAFRGPIPSTRLFLEVGNLNEAARVDPPAPPPGTKALGAAESFGGFESYLVLSERIDPQRALEAADVVEGGRAIAYRAGGRVCYRVALAANGGARQAFLAAAFASWAHANGQRTVARSSDGVLITACDPGASAHGESQTRFVQSALLLGARAGVTEAAVDNGVDLVDAWCTARLFVRTPGMVSLAEQLGANHATPQQALKARAALVDARDHCDADPESGLP